MFIKRLLFFLVFYSGTSILSLSIPGPIKTAGSWAIAAGPLWFEACHYARLLSDSNACSVYGSEDVPKEHGETIREMLKDLGYKHWQTITVKSIKKEMRAYVLSAAISTDSILFINHDYYDELIPEEKRAIIAHALTGIERKHLLKKASALAVIPLITYGFIKLCLKSFDAISDRPPLTGPEKVFEYAWNSCFLKLLLNTMAAAQVLKWQEKTTDLQTAKIAGSSNGLASYYSTMSKKPQANNQLRAWFQPTLKERISYLQS